MLQVTGRNVPPPLEINDDALRNLGNRRFISSLRFFAIFARVGWHFDQDPIITITIKKGIYFVDPFVSLVEAQFPFSLLPSAFLSPPPLSLLERSSILLPLFVAHFSSKRCGESPFRSPNPEPSIKLLRRSGRPGDRGHPHPSKAHPIGRISFARAETGGS